VASSEIRAFETGESTIIKERKLAWGPMLGGQGGNVVGKHEGLNPPEFNFVQGLPFQTLPPGERGGNASARGRGGGGGGGGTDWPWP